MNDKSWDEVKGLAEEAFKDAELQQMFKDSYTMGTNAAMVFLAVLRSPCPEDTPRGYLYEAAMEAMRTYISGWWIDKRYEKEGE